MSYVAKTLAGGEEILYRANFNWTYTFFPTLWFSFGLTPLVMLGLIQLGAGVPFSELVVAWWCAGFGAAFGMLILINHLIVLITTEIIVTTFRFVYKVGLLSRKTQEVSLNKIEEITLVQSVWGRLFGYGKLTMHGTGVGVITLPNIDNPIRVRKAVENAKAALRKSDRDERSNGD